MTAGIPGIGLGGLFFVISALLMLVFEIFHTVRGRSSLARWRFVGRQVGIAAAIVLVTALALWLLDLAVLQSDAGVNGGSESSLASAVATVSFPGSPVLVTLAFLAGVLCLAEMMGWVVRRRPSPSRVESLPDTGKKV